jgi:hypothetical protein
MGTGPKEIYDDMLVALGDKHHSYSIVKKWVTRFRTGHLSTEDKQRFEDQLEETIPENVDAIHSMILDD